MGRRQRELWCYGAECKQAGAAMAAACGKHAEPACPNPNCRGLHLPPTAMPPHLMLATAESALDLEEVSKLSSSCPISWSSSGSRASSVLSCMPAKLCRLACATAGTAAGEAAARTPASCWALRRVWGPPPLDGLAACCRPAGCCCGCLLPDGSAAPAAAGAVRGAACCSGSTATGSCCASSRARSLSTKVRGWISS